MSITTYEPSHQSKLKCRDCDYQTDHVEEYSEHIRVCKVNPVPMPQAEVERREADSTIFDDIG